MTPYSAVVYCTRLFGDLVQNISRLAAGFLSVVSKNEYKYQLSVRILALCQLKKKQK